MNRALITLAMLVLAGPASAQSAQDAAKADGKAFGQQQAGAAQSAATTDPDAARIPNFTPNSSQGGYFSDPDAMSRQAASSASSNAGYSAMRDSMNSRATFNPVDLDATIARSKTISSDPLTYTSGMSVSATQGRCVPLPAGSGSAARYMATCNVGYTVASGTQSCTIPLEAKIEQRASYKYYAQLVRHYGLTPEMSQFSAAIAAGTCTDIGAADECQLIRDYGLTPNKYCTDYHTDVVQCTDEVPGLTGNKFPGTGQLWFAKDGTNTVSTARNESACASLAANLDCTAPTETCTDSTPETRTVDGVAVTAPCWAWQRDYKCNTFTPAQDCATLEKTPDCRFVRQDCITDEEPCKTYERVYDCPVSEQPADPNQFICDGDVYCIDGSCETIERQANTEFKDAVVALNAMDQATKEFDPNSLTLFKGERSTCSSKVFGILNCCKGKGFPLIPGISLLVALGCDREEVLLHQRDAQGLCAYVGTYCSTSFLGVCLVKKKVYCCFESKLSRILQEQGRQQLNKPWAKPKQEQCAGFTIDEFARLDLSKMDFSEVYAEFTDAAKLPDELQTTTQLQQKIEDYYARSHP